MKIIPPSLFSFFTDVKRLVWIARNKGDKVFCPFCGRQFSKFMPGGIDNQALVNVFGAGIRKNSICPKCNSTDRERHVFLYLKQKNLLGISSGTRLLHVAPERNLKRLFATLHNLDYVTSDLCPERTSASVKMDITHINYPDDYFDIIICNHVLEHILEDSIAMGELFRVLKTKGWAILQVPFDPTKRHTYEDSSITSTSERLRKFGQSDHVRIYGEDYADRLQKAGFKVWIDRLISSDEKITEKYGLIKNEPIFFCRKPSIPN